MRYIIIPLLISLYLWWSWIHIKHIKLGELNEAFEWIMIHLLLGVFLIGYLFCEYVFPLIIKYW